MSMFGDVDTSNMRRSDNVLDLVPRSDEPPNQIDTPYGTQDDFAFIDIEDGVRVVNVGRRFYTVPARGPEGERLGENELRDRIMQRTYPILGVYPRESAARQDMATYPERQERRRSLNLPEDRLRGRGRPRGDDINIDPEYQ
jgi:hypothetical protein